MLMICACCVPVAALESTGMSEKLTMPASVSKTRLPIERLEMVVVDDEASTVKIPLEPPVAELAAVPAPIETRPVLETLRKVVVAAPVVEAMLKSERSVSPRAPKTESLAHGVEVPMPTLPVLRILKSVDVELLVEEAMRKALLPGKTRP